MLNNFKCCAKNSLEARDINRLYVFLRAISDSNRLKIICILKNQPRCVCEIVSAIGISDKLVSHHLKKLKNAGLLIEKREGNFIRYFVNKKSLREYKKIFNQII